MLFSRPSFLRQPTGSIGQNFATPKAQAAPVVTSTQAQPQQTTPQEQIEFPMWDANMIKMQREKAGGNRGALNRAYYDYMQTMNTAPKQPLWIDPSKAAGAQQWVDPYKTARLVSLFGRKA